MTNLPTFIVYIKVGNDQRDIRVRALNAASAIKLVIEQHATKFERRWGSIFA